jgi:trans-aconitate 2-methyltransferase
MTWNPTQYLKFAAPRLRPALDLLARIELEDPKRIYDLGCGAGQLTRLMAERWPAARVTGVDSSAAMLEASRAAPGGSGLVDWVQADLADWRPASTAAADAPDLIYSNAALHWLPDHATCFPRLLGTLAPGGVLAVQMPRNFNAPSHTLIGDTIQAGPWRERLASKSWRSPVAEPAWYFDMLSPHAASVELWETEYLQVLSGPDPVKEYTKGTWLVQFLEALADDGERALFEADYAARVRKAYPARADGRTLFPFRRLFMIVRRGR